MWRQLLGFEWSADSKPSATPEGGEKQHVCGVRWRRSRAIRVSSKLLLVALSL